VSANTDVRRALVWGLIAFVISSVPYLIGALISPAGYHFLGLTHNIDDGAVYLSWIRQAADGHFFIRNLFTSEPQAARQFNMLFLLMGWTVRLTGLAPIWVYHIFRAALTIALAFALRAFAARFLRDNAKSVFLPIVLFSAGVGWAFGPMNPIQAPVDTWQPEAITFLSVYLNPLFLVGMILMVGSFHYLMLAKESGLSRYAIYAGLCLMLLGNVHTYDVVTVFAVWAVYLLGVAIRSRSPQPRLWLHCAIAAGTSLPPVLYQFYVYWLDPVFSARVNSPAPSPAIWWYFAGYGVVLLGAVVGVVSLFGVSKDTARDDTPGGFPALPYVWAVIGFVLPYLPVAQQRKLAMGLHIPICILCAIGIAWAVERLRPRGRVVAVGAAILFWTAASLSNVMFLARDALLLTEGRTVTHYVAYMSSDDLAAMRYLRENAGPGEAILAPPTFALFVPAIAGRQVYYGHWSETPDYAGKLRQWARLVDPETPTSERLEILADTGARFYVADTRSAQPDAGLELVFTSGDTSVYAVR